MGATSSSVELGLIRRALDGYEPQQFAVEMWDGASWRPEAGAPARFTLAIARPGTVRAILLRPSLETVGELYLRGDLDVRGDLTAAFGVVGHVVGERTGLLARLLEAPLRLGGSSKARTRRSVNFHYDLPLEFFRLWLDPEMVYTCAYFTSEETGLEEAQRRKLDYVCRKLRLRAGERLLDVGCGWGALVAHAVEHYGVTATGITLSEKQAAFARERVERAGLTSRCTVEVRDFRDLEGDAAFDKISSVGMIEHVREPQQPDYFAKLWRLVRPGGLVFNQGIASVLTRPLGSGSRFLHRHVFPDHELVPVSAVLRVAEAAGFEVRDVESLREHYARTLRAWYDRLEAAEARAREIVGERTLRAFKVYLAGMSHHFGTGDLNVYQVVLSKPKDGASGLPLTRADLYEE